MLLFTSSFHDTTSGSRACWRQKSVWRYVCRCSRCRKPARGNLKTDQHCVDGRRAGRDRLLVLSDSILLPVSSSPAFSGGCSELENPWVHVVSTMKPFGEQSHPSRRTGCIKRSTQQYSDTLDEGGAVRGQAQCQRMSSKITDGGSSQMWVHAWHGSYPCTRRPLGTRRTTLPACRLLCHLRLAVNRYRTP
jgi:hypothetical protein